MEFKELCDLFQKVKDTKGFKEKSKIVRDFFDLTRVNNSGVSFFSIIRLLVPKLDRERSSYNMKEAKIARIIIKMLALPEGRDKNVLTKSYLAQGSCDFGEIVHSVIRKYMSYTTSITIQDLNLNLDELSKRANEKEAEDILLKVFRQCSASDVKWIIRLLLKDLKIGLDGNRMLNCYHPDASNYFSTNYNLKKVVKDLNNPSLRLHELEVKLFDPFRPMLSRRLDAMAFKKFIVDKKVFFVENKFDGERFQLHKSYDNFKYFSRNCFDYSSYFGETFSRGTLTPYLKNVFKSGIKELILDGEMMLWNTRDQKFGSKGMTLDVKKLGLNQTYRPCFCVYDILFLNGQVLTNKPLRERSKILDNILNETEGVIQVSSIKEVSSQKEIIEELNASVAKQDEGIVIKDPESVYKFGDRNAGWFKMKLEFFNEVMNDLDLILMGASYGASKKLNSFFLGVKSGSTSQGLPCYVAFGRVASGLNNEQLEFLNNKLKNNGHPYGEFLRSNNEELVFGNDLPHYWIEPKKSCCLLIRASELIRCTDKNFKTPYTFRFPRVLAIREDKPVEDCLSMNELLDLSQQHSHVIKLNKMSLSLEEILKVCKKKKEIKPLELVGVFKKRKLPEVLKGLKVCVLNKSENKGKRELEHIVKQAGGLVTSYLNPSLDLVLVGSDLEKLDSLVATRPNYDFISIKWLERCLENGETLPYNHSEIFYLGGSYKNSLNDNVDSYGDSLIEPSSIEDLKKTFKILDSIEELLLDELIERNDLFKTRLRFEPYLAYFDENKLVNDLNSEKIYDSYLDQLEFRYFGGRVSQNLIPEVNLIICQNDQRKTYLLQALEDYKMVHTEIKCKSFIYEN